MKVTKSPSRVGVLNGEQAAPNGRLIRRTEAARMLKMSVSTLRRYEHQRHPTVGPDGVHLFDEVELRSAAITISRRRAIATMGASAGDVAADVFTLLDGGTHPVEIVKQLRVAPDVVAALLEQWTQMRGGFFVSKDEAFELGCISRRHQPRTAGAAIADLRRYVEQLKQSKRGSTQCQCCLQVTASICEPCAVDWRGPLITSGVKLERQASETGEELLRVVIDAAWCDSIDPSGSQSATLRSDWHPRTKMAKSEIGAFVDAIDARDDLTAGASSVSAPRM